MSMCQQYISKLVGVTRPALDLSNVASVASVMQTTQLISVAFIQENSMGGPVDCP